MEDHRSIGRDAERDEVAECVGVGAWGDIALAMNQLQRSHFTCEHSSVVRRINDSCERRYERVLVVITCECPLHRVVENARGRLRGL